MYQWAIFSPLVFLLVLALCGAMAAERGGAVWMTMMQLNDVSIQSQKANSSSPTALPMTPLCLHSTMHKL
jgi:hypothetical protein